MPITCLFIAAMSHVFGGKYSKHLDCIGWFRVHAMDCYQARQVTSKEKRRKLSSICSCLQRYGQYSVTPTLHFTPPYRCRHDTTPDTTRNMCPIRRCALGHFKRETRQRRLKEKEEELREEDEETKLRRRSSALGPWLCLLSRLGKKKRTEFLNLFIIKPWEKIFSTCTLAFGFVHYWA